MSRFPSVDSLRIIAHKGAVYCAIGLGFSLPVSVALDNVLLGLAVVLWLVSWPWAEAARIRTNPLVVAALLMLALCGLGLFYGNGELGEGLRYLKKYLDLLYVPVFVLLFRDARARHAGIRAFEVAMLITLAASYLLALGVLPWTEPFTANPLSGVTVFKYQITHNIFMAFAAYLFAERARVSGSPIGRSLWGVACGLAVINVLFMVTGRTGYIVLFALILIFWWRVFGPKGLVAAATGLVVAIVLAMSGSNAFSDRVRLAAAEARSWEYGTGIDTSIGDRLNFYTTTARIIREHPIVGVGLSGFPAAYRDQIEGTQIEAAKNPHNQFLLFGAQLGVVGLAAYMWLLWTLWSCSRRIDNGFERLAAQGLLVTAVISSMLNSFLLDHSEGLFFAWLAALACAQLGENRGTETT